MYGRDIMSITERIFQESELKGNLFTIKLNYCVIFILVFNILICDWNPLIDVDERVFAWYSFEAVMLLLMNEFIKYRKGIGSDIKYIECTLLLLCAIQNSLMFNLLWWGYFYLPIILSVWYSRHIATAVVGCVCSCVGLIVAFVQITYGLRHGYFNYNYMMTKETCTVTIPSDYHGIWEALFSSGALDLDFAYTECFFEQSEPFCIGLAITIVCTFMAKNNRTLIQAEIDDMEKAARLQEEEKKQALQQVEMKNLQTKVMLSQIQPHFVYNTLSSIAALCDIDPQKAKRIAIDFTNYLRGNLKTLSIVEPVLFELEMRHTELYLRIEKERFGDRLNYELDICANEFFIPALTVQPLVENAVKHGLCSRAEGGNLIISSYEIDDGYEIIIEDNGVGFDTAAIDWDDGTHIGIANARERLKYFCNGTITIRSSLGNGTLAKIFIPREKVNE